MTGLEALQKNQAQILAIAALLPWQAT